MGDIHRPQYEIRDPIYGLIKISEAEREIINTPVFQRLRDIRQLAVAHYVYPGATHTRFEHSIGCMHLSDRLLRQLVDNEGRNGSATFDDAFNLRSGDVWHRNRYILRLAALLHDLGHAPFSHSGEHLMPRVEDAKIDHEAMTATLIRDTAIGQLIDQQFREQGITAEKIIAIATKPSFSHERDRLTPLDYFLHNMLTGDLGTDRMDYLVRDAVHSGQPTGVFDVQRLMDEMTIVDPIADDREDHSGPVLGLHEDGRLAAEHMYICRYVMYVSLYFHKTKRIYEKHMERFLPFWLQEEFGTSTLPINVSSYQALTESGVWHCVLKAARNTKHPGYADARPFVDRDHFRLACEVLPAENRRKDGGGLDQTRLDKFRTFVQNTFGGEVIVDEPANSAYKFKREGAKILVLSGGEIRNLEQFSEIVRDLPEQIWRFRVYAACQRCGAIGDECRKWLKENPPEKVDG